MPDWSPDTPARTGVSTLRLLAKNMCRLLTRFTPIILLYLEPSKHVYVTALNQACSEFVENVSNPNPRGE